MSETIEDDDDIILAYENVRKKGLTNMLHVRNVTMLMNVELKNKAVTLRGVEMMLLRFMIDTENTYSKALARAESAARLKNE